MNLLDETIKALRLHSRTLEDVEWIGGDYFSISKEQFMQLADTEYDSGYGGQEVAKDLVVVGKDFWLERHEYDGSEGWSFKVFPTKFEEVNIHALTEYQTTGNHSGWETLAEMNDMEEN